VQQEEMSSRLSDNRLQPSALISGKFKQKFFFMTPMRNMPNMTWKEMPARQRQTLAGGPFCSCNLPVLFS
jgi:hypothetical protein